MIIGKTNMLKPCPGAARITAPAVSGLSTALATASISSQVFGGSTPAASSRSLR